MKFTVDPTKVRSCSGGVLSLADIINHDHLPSGKRIARVYEQSYWYALGRMDGESGGQANHAEADLFGRARATAMHRMLNEFAVSTASMVDDYENAFTVHANVPA